MAELEQVPMKHGMMGPDRRPIDEVRFARDGYPNAGDREEVVRDVFRRAGAVTAEDAIDLGDTGLSAKGFSVETIREVRMNMTGAGFSLTCYVPPDRYCLVHETIGALQRLQKQNYPERVEAISRELTDLERDRVRAVESASRILQRGQAARDIAEARDLLEGVEVPENVGDLREAARKEVERKLRVATEIGVVRNGVASGPQAWTCPEHAETVWSCRFCVAGEIARGELVPEFVAEVDGAPAIPVVASGVDELLGGQANSIELYARVGNWKRKLSR